MRRPLDYLLLFLKGAAMGAADVVPGVSGGTIAFISGIYRELLCAIQSINLRSLRLLFRQGPVAFWRAINGNFLLVLFGGILLSILSLAKLVSFAMADYPLLVWSFFFGLIVASIVWMSRHLGRWRWQEMLGLMIGSLISGALFFLPPLAVGDGLAVVFCAGALAICAMILPGISGSFILVLIGMYSILIDAISQLNLPVLLTFGLGCATGLLLFSRVLSWLLGNYQSATLSILVGFLVGSLATVWPWKIELVVTYSSSGKKIVLDALNQLPGDYALQTGIDPQTSWAVLLMLFGVALVLGLEYIGGKRTKV